MFSVSLFDEPIVTLTMPMLFRLPCVTFTLHGRVLGPMIVVVLRNDEVELRLTMSVTAVIVNLSAVSSFCDSKLLKEKPFVPRVSVRLSIAQVVVGALM